MSSTLRPIGLRITLIALLALHVALAVIFMVGGPLRFSGPAYNTALAVLPTTGRAVAFGLGALSLLLTWKHRTWLVAQLTAGMFLYLFWAMCFLLSAAHTPSVGLTGSPVWGFCAIVQLACASTVYGPHLRKR